MLKFVEFGESTILRLFVAWVFFMKVTFSCINLKPDDGFSLYIMPEVFDNTGHSLTDIIIVWDEFKPVLHPEFFTHNSTYIYCVQEWNWKPSISGRSRTAATSKMEHFVIIVNGWKPLTIITKCSILDVAAAPDLPLSILVVSLSIFL